MLCLRFGTQRRQPRRRQVCARRDALSSWHEVRRPLPHRPGPSTHARDRRRSSEAPPAPAAPSCRRHTGAPQARLDPHPGRLLRRRLVSILHPGQLTPDALAPQARLDPPPGWRARRGLLPSARTAGCVVAFVIAELRAPSRSSTAGGATPHGSQSCSREPLPPPLACPPRARRPSRPRGPGPAVHARPRQRLGLGRSALVGDVAAAARREPRRRPDGKSIRSCESPVRVPCAVCRATR